MMTLTILPSMGKRVYLNGIRKLEDIDLSVTSRRMCLVCEWSLLGFFSSDRQCYLKAKHNGKVFIKVIAPEDSVSCQIRAQRIPDKFTAEVRNHSIIQLLPVQYEFNYTYLPTDEMLLVHDTKYHKFYESIDICTVNSFPFVSVIPVCF